MLVAVVAQVGIKKYCSIYEFMKERVLVEVVASEIKYFLREGPWL